MSLRNAFQNITQHFLPDVGLMLSGIPARSFSHAREETLYGAILQRVFGVGHYDAGNAGRLNADWSTAYDTPYWNFKATRESIIARSIRMVDNNPTAKAILETIVADVVGTGIKPQPRVKFASGEPIKGINDVLAEGWARYNDEWDSTRHDTFYESQQIVLRELITSGAVLTNKLRSAPGSHLGICTQLVPVLRLDCSKDHGAPVTSMDPRAKQTVFGINLDARGQPVSYWIQGIKEPVSAEFMHQVYKRLRAEEHTGIPWFTAALKYLWANEELTKDKLIASRIQAMIGMVMPRNMWNKLAAQHTNPADQLEMKSGRIYHYDGTSKPEILQADDSIKEVLIPLQQLLLHAISVSMGWSYQTVTRDVTKINMAAGKINTNKDRQAAGMIQRFLSKTYCQDEYAHFVFRMFLEGKVPGHTAVDFRRDPWKYTQCQWRPPGWDFIDPYREAQAIKLLRDSRLMTLEEWYSKHGGIDWHDAIDQLAVEEEYMKGKGVKIQAPAPVGAAAPASEDGENEDETNNQR